MLLQGWVNLFSGIKLEGRELLLTLEHDGDNLVELNCSI
ncbi:hypothetical protein C942_04666 [Photobacterium marinum]|uniref:Uncharacterized protein n=1 Tax=Photobacterium marinum TaxID=1056511 RepID=L8JHN2_9GAMM|nr:hypothetical protein C942_04666 [Photobacterium marinum]